MNVDVFCKIISEFALEYRTTRDRVLIQNEKRANQRERKKTRGKMIVEVGFFSFHHLYYIVLLNPDMFIDKVVVALWTIEVRA